VILSDAAVSEPLNIILVAVMGPAVILPVIIEALVIPFRVESPLAVISPDALKTPFKKVEPAVMGPVESDAL